MFFDHYILYQKLKSATIDHVPDALRLPKRRDREPLPHAAAAASGPVTQAMQPNPSPNTMTTNATVQGYAHPGFASHGMHGFPLLSGPAFPMQPYPMPNYPLQMYAQPYGYPFVPQGPGTQAIQPNRYLAHPNPFMMPNYPMPAPMYAPPSGFPFTMPPPQGANLDSDYGRRRRHSVSDHQYNSDLLDAKGTLNTDPSLGPVPEWITQAEQDTPDSES